MMDKKNVPNKLLGQENTEERGITRQGSSFLNHVHFI